MFFCTKLLISCECRIEYYFLLVVKKCVDSVVVNLLVLQFASFWGGRDNY